MSEEAGRFIHSFYKFKIRENDGEIIKPNYSDELCQYIKTQASDTGHKCEQPVEQGSMFCGSYGERKGFQKEAANKRTHFALRWKATKDLSFFRDNQTLTDINVIVDGISFHAHKLILAIASPYFEALCLSGFKEASNNYIVLKDISCKVFRLYIDLMYGKEITINNWRTAFDLFDYLKMTLVNWNKDSTATLFHVPPEEYVEYIKRLYLLYDDDVPEEIIKKTSRYVTSTVDLSSFDPAFIKLLRPITIELHVNDEGNGYFREITKGLIIRNKTYDYYCLGYIPSEYASLPFSLDLIVPLTLKLKKYCESLGICCVSDK